MLVVGAGGIEAEWQEGEHCWHTPSIIFVSKMFTVKVAMYVLPAGGMF